MTCCILGYYTVIEIIEMHLKFDTPIIFSLLDIRANHGIFDITTG
jgi:hypothetical protein